MLPTSTSPIHLPRAGAARRAARAPGASERAERLIELSDRIQRTLGIARILVEGGRVLDLTGLDDGIGILCAQTLDLAEGEARIMLPYLNAVLAQADQLSTAIRGSITLVGRNER